jgi:hypothetical protein
LVDSVYLHDARILDMWQGIGDRVTITLQPESDPSRLVVLVYGLLEPPQINPDALPEAVRCEVAAWLYDEVDLEPAGDGKGPPTFTHDILFSNGWEVRLRFRDVTISRPVPLLPAVPA